MKRYKVRDPLWSLVRGWWDWVMVQPVRCFFGRHRYKFSPRQCIRCGAPML